MLTGSDSFSRALPPDSALTLLNVFPWPGWKGMSREGLSICDDVSSLNLVCNFTFAKYGWLTEGRKPRKEDGTAFEVSIFTVFWTISVQFFFLFVRQKEFPFTESLGSCFSLTSVQMVSADLRKDAARITVNFVYRCTVGQLLGGGNYANSMWKPFRRPVAFHAAGFRLIVWA